MYLKRAPFAAITAAVLASAESQTSAGGAAIEPATVPPPAPGFDRIKFYFKSRKEKVVKEDGSVEEKKIEAPKPISLDLKLITPEDVVAIFNKNDEREMVLIMEGLRDVQLARVKDLLDEDREKIRAEGLVPDLYSWAAIAALPPATRKGAAIPDETWDAFEADYVDVMVHHGKEKKQAETGAKLLSRKFAPVKGNKKVIKKLQENLQVWIANTAKAEEFQQVYETLASKAESLLNIDEDALTAAI